jgi:glycine/D-amino acid oxidase-like deaminating enzyme
MPDEGRVLGGGVIGGAVSLALGRHEVDTAPLEARPALGSDASGGVTTPHLDSATRSVEHAGHGGATR